MKRKRGGIVLKSPREIEIMREANRHTADILAKVVEAVAPGVSTEDLDSIAREEIDRRRVKSAFLGYYGYPAVLCTSVNDRVVHGIPRKDDVLKEGDVIGIDFGVVHKGYVGDTARTVCVGSVAPEVRELVELTKRSLDVAINVCKPGVRLSEIGKAVEGVAAPKEYGIVREFVGHGIGTHMHEDPQVPNYYNGPLPRLREGMVIAIEPMLNLGTHEVEVLDDDWTAVTRDGSVSAHFEHSVAIIDGGVEVLSAY